MNSRNIPEPGVMPIDRDGWAKQLNFSNFINTYYQYRDLQLCKGCKKVLIIGPGQGFDTLVLRWRGYEVTTFDIDNTFSPDYEGSVHEMKMFKDGQFDVVIASHVLEHLAVPYLDISLQEIARVGEYALVYVPVAGYRHGQLRFILGIRNIDFSIVWDFFNYFEKPDGLTAAYCNRQHFWEVGLRGFRVKDIKKRLSPHFSILADYRNHDWMSSYNFVLKSKLA